MVLKVKKLKPSRIFQHVVEQIQDAILNGNLKPGDILPSEMKLKEMFDTSRGTIREALRVLEQKGLVNIRTGVGGGAVVKALETENITESLSLFVQTQNISFDHLAEFREAIEGTVTALAAERAREKDIRKLKAILNDARLLLKNKKAGLEDFSRIDGQLHIAIAEIAGNPIFTAVLKMVHDNIMGHYERYSIFWTEEHSFHENYRDISDIVDAIDRRDSKTARSLAEHHVRKFDRMMKDADKKQ